MPRLVQSLGLTGNPFEHYVAETEPNIAEYAVKPPYFEAIDARAKHTTSFVLFGDRGAGPSTPPTWSSMENSLPRGTGAIVGNALEVLARRFSLH